jgi:hypothetical protein
MSDKIYNFQTGRFIQRYGSAHKKLLKAGLTNENSSDTKKKVKSKEKVIRQIEVSSEEEQDEEVVVKLAKSNKKGKSLKKPVKNVVSKNDTNKSKKAQQKIQEILNIRLSKKQIQNMNDAQITSFVQKKYIEDCRIKKDDTEDDTEEDNGEEDNEDEDNESDSE